MFKYYELYENDVVLPTVLPLIVLPFTGVFEYVLLSNSSAMYLYLYICSLKVP